MTTLSTLSIRSTFLLRQNNHAARSIDLEQSAQTLIAKIREVDGAVPADNDVMRAVLVDPKNRARVWTEPRSREWIREMPMMRVLGGEKGKEKQGSALLERSSANASGAPAASAAIVPKERSENGNLTVKETATAPPKTTPAAVNGISNAFKPGKRNHDEMVENMLKTTSDKRTRRKVERPDYVTH